MEDKITGVTGPWQMIGSSSGGRADFGRLFRQSARGNDLSQVGR